MNFTKSEEQRILDIQQKLECSRKEAIDVLQSDKEIDKGAKLFELSDRQKQASKQARQIARKPRKQENRTRTVDNEKIEFMQKLVKFLETLGATDIILENPERQVDFKLPHGEGLRKHRIVFSAPRK